MTASWIKGADGEPPLIERIRALLRGADAISFAELDQFDWFHGARHSSFGDNRVLWPWTSAQAVADIAALIAADECHFGPASLLTYLCDGRVPRMPLANTDRECSAALASDRVFSRRAARTGAGRAETGAAPAAETARERKRVLIPGKLRARR